MNRAMLHAWWLRTTSRPALARTVVALGVAMVFVGVATWVSPDVSVASEGAGDAPLAATPERMATSLGTLERPGITIHMLATGAGPRYTAVSEQGHVIVEEATLTELAAALPELDVELWFASATMMADVPTY